MALPNYKFCQFYRVTYKNEVSESIPGFLDIVKVEDKYLQVRSCKAVEDCARVDVL